MGVVLKRFNIFIKLLKRVGAQKIVLRNDEQKNDKQIEIKY
jgi:hypothetical protein